MILNLQTSKEVYLLPILPNIIFYILIHSTQIHFVECKVHVQ
jgi:hypothetical protein